MTWLNQYIYSEHESDRVELTHIIPIGDLRGHELTVHCWCGPTRDEECPSTLLHHAADGREQYEDGTRRPH